MHVAVLAICIVLCLATPARAASLNQAGLIVDYGDGSTSWVWVPFEGEELSVMELLEQSDLEVVTVGFGGMGEAVCQIGPTGCSVDDCRRKLCQTNSSSPFWRVLVKDGDEWRMSGNGVSGTKVADGDVAVLYWGSDDLQMPVESIAVIADKAGADKESESIATRTYGQNDDDQAIGSWAPTIAALGGLGAVAGVLVYRTKAARQVAA